MSMENLLIKGQKDSFYVPNVDFNAKTGICSLSGQSYLEDTSSFYLRILEWIRDYCSENDSIQFNIKLTYYNTSSSRSILDILDLLKMYEEKGVDVEVNWFCSEVDYSIVQEEVEDFMDESDLEINLISLAE